MYYTHTPQTHTQRREEESQHNNSHKTSGGQLKASNLTSLFCRQDDAQLEKKH